MPRDASNWEPIRTYRCSDPIYDAMRRATADRGETVTDVILRAFDRYLRDWPGHPVDGE